MKKTAFIGITVLALALVAVLAVNQVNAARGMTYNANPDVSNKMVCSKPLANAFYETPLESIDDLLRFADLVAVGEVVSDGTVTTAEWGKVHNDPEGKTEMSSFPPVTVTHTKVKISKVLYGETKSDTITVLQAGEGELGETKIKKGQKLVMLLRDGAEGDNIYSSVSWEKGFFEIGQDNRLVSFSDDLVVAKYDKTSLDLLTRDIARGMLAVKGK